MPIIPSKPESKKDSEGYDLDSRGDRIYPPWAAYVPPGAGTSHASSRPPWVPLIANFWDPANPPDGWSQNDAGEWVQRRAAREQVQPAEVPVVVQEPEVDLKCPVCDRDCATPVGLKVHMAHHRKTDEHHAEAEKVA